MTINSVTKGKRGEVEFCQWLFDNLRIVVDREYNQSQGGADIITTDFIFEVKRREVLALNDWWHQVIIASKKYPNKNLIPVVVFRQNRKPWEFLIPANLILGLDKGFLRCSEQIFLQFATFLMKKSIDA